MFLNGYKSPSITEISKWHYFENFQVSLYNVLAFKLKITLDDLDRNSHVISDRNHGLIFFIDSAPLKEASQ